MKVLVTGSNGFIAKNLIVHLHQDKDIEVIEYQRSHSLNDLKSMLARADFVYHLAGENRPLKSEAFLEVNFGLTKEIVNNLNLLRKDIPLIFASSIQADLDNHYGQSKLLAERFILDEYFGENKMIYRLPNVFGKWARPNYNSVVATFCHNIANGLDVQVNDPRAVVNLVYIDDVVRSFIQSLHDIRQGAVWGSSVGQVAPIYQISVGDLKDKLTMYRQSRENLLTEPVGQGLDRALYATFLSYYAPENFSYRVPMYSDPRGKFVEMLKTKDSGQFSFFTARPGIVRGVHYHHTKSEKFLVMVGKALFRFRNISTNDYYEMTVLDSDSIVVESIPGWSHSIQNIGDGEMVVMLWANEIFDRSKPDTIGYEV